MVDEKIISYDIPTYKIGDPDIIVYFLEPIIIDNKLYKPRDNTLEGCDRKYKLPAWVAIELCELGYCVYQIRPEDLFKGVAI